MGAERLSRIFQGALNSFCERVRAAEQASRDPFRVLERRHCLAEIVERGGGVLVERLREIPLLLLTTGVMLAQLHKSSKAHALGMTNVLAAVFLYNAQDLEKHAW